MKSKVTYRQQYTRCGKQRCRKCREGAGHGPYWYAYWSEKGRTVSKYIGTNLPEQIAAARQVEGEEKSENIIPPGLHDTSTPTLRIYLLGQFRVEYLSNGEWRMVDSRTWHRRRARALLGCLLSNAGRRLGREQVMELLWPDLEIDLAANRLNGAVHELRQILEPDIARPAASRMLRLERDMLELADSTRIWVDAEEFERLLKEADLTSDPERSEDLLENAAALYHGSYLLEELYSEWATPRRDALQRAWVGLLLKLADIRAEQGAFVSAIETLDRLRTAEPTNETALQRLMILLTELDRRGEALQMYRQHVAMLERDYEGEPLPETRDLYEALRKGYVPATYAKKTRSTITKEQEEKPTQEHSPASPVTSPVPLQKVSFTRPVFQSGRHNQSPLIGRERERALMQELILETEGMADKHEPPLSDEEHAAAFHRVLPSSSSRPQHTHFLLLKGDSGIGKTRLAEELSLEAYKRGWIVAWSRSYEQEGTIPYRPWTELLRTLVQSTSTFTELVNMASPSGVSGGQNTSPLKLERLSALLPELANHTSPSLARPSPAVPHEQERLHLWEATLGLLGLFSKFHPLLLVLDDLHWADESSIELLTYLAHHLQEQPILLVGTCREGELTPQHKLRTLTADLQREQTIAVVPVLPLTSSQIGTLISYLPQDVVQSIQSQAAGNPFFAEELARYVGVTYSEDDALAAIGLERQEENGTRKRKTVLSGAKRTEQTLTLPTLPEAVAAVLERRLNRLSTGCQTLLSKAAVLGGSFELSQLLPMATEYAEDTVLDLLEEALHAGLLTEEGTGAHISYHFWHPLIINHLYSRLSAARRAQLHRKAAEAIKAANAGQAEKGAAAIVYHLGKGGSDPAAVAHYAELAGNQAYSLAAYAEAQQYYLLAIRILVDNEPYALESGDAHTHTHDITARALTQLPITDPLRVCRLLEHVAECSNVQGNFEDARHLYERVLDLRTSDRFQRAIYGSTGENAGRQEAQIAALLWREIGNTWAVTGEYEQAYTCYERGTVVMSEAGVTSGAAWASLLLRYGAILRLEGNYQEALRYLQEALTILEQVVQQPQTHEQDAEMTRTGRRAGPGRETSQGTQETALAGPPTRTERALLGDPLELGYAHERLGIVAASMGRLNDALQHLHTTLTIYESSELVSEMARVCGNLGAVYITKGEHEAARTYLHRSLDLAERAGDLPNMAFVTLNLGDVAQRSGNLLEAREWFKQSLVLTERVNDREHMSWCNAALAAVQEDLGELQQAAQSIKRAITIGRAIKSMRCIRYALVWLADIRIAYAITSSTYPIRDTVSDQQARWSKRQLLRAKSTLQRAIALEGEGLEVENIIDGKYLLAQVHYLLGDLAAAQHLARQTLKEAQAHETTRIIGRAYRMLGFVYAAQEDHEQADRYFQQAIQVCVERGLRLDHARALRGYGEVLLQRSLLPSHTQPERTANEAEYQRGLEYVHAARSIFSECHAAIDLIVVEQILKKYPVPSALKM